MLFFQIFHAKPPWFLFLFCVWLHDGYYHLQLITKETVQPCTSSLPQEKAFPQLSY